MLLATPLLAGFALLAACSLDWSVRSAPGDASTAAESGGAADAADAPAPVDAADGSVPTDAPISPEAAACQALESDVALKKKKARECQIGTPGQCTSTVDDECACKVVVTLAAATATNDYKSAVSAYAAQCMPKCVAACPQIGVPASWACLSNAGDVRCTP